MVGITSYGAYVPLWRLNRGAIAKGARGEKPICNFDEDSVTMAVAAAIDCLHGVERETIDGLFFASTTFPYKEKQSAATVAAGADLSRNIVTADFASSLKGGTTALKLALDSVKAGSAKQIMVTAADRRQGAPLSAFDQNFGDGAAAILVGDTKVIASMEGSYSVSDEILDTWSSQGDTFLRTTFPRFTETEGYANLVGKAIAGLFEKTKLTAKDFARIVLYAPNARRAAEVAKRAGFDAKTQLQDVLANDMGNTGTPYALMLLVSALETANPGDLVLLAGYGDGADALAFKVTEEIEKVRKNVARRGVTKYLASKRILDDYKTYWQWRGLLNPETEAGFLAHHFWKMSTIAIWRERNRILRFHGAKCQACGTVQYPPQRVCSQCHTKDKMEEIRLYDKKATVFSYSMDYVSSEVDVPIVVPIVAFEGGGKAIMYMTDEVPDEIEVGMEVELSFRKIFVREGVHNYFWKPTPVRA
ncbi:hydroxymethylglutaryl-CoA synthase family protein [Chloroflexota bacterium]